MDFGVVVEGVVELDPISGRMVIRSDSEKGFDYLDVQEALTKYQGQEVRFIVAPFSTINQLAAMVDQGEVTLEDLPLAGTLKQ